MLVSTTKKTMEFPAIKLVVSIQNHRETSYHFPAVIHVHLYINKLLTSNVYYTAHALIYMRPDHS